MAAGAIGATGAFAVYRLADKQVLNHELAPVPIRYLKTEEPIVSVLRLKVKHVVLRHVPLQLLPQARVQ